MSIETIVLQPPSARPESSPRTVQLRTLSPFSQALMEDLKMYNPAALIEGDGRRRRLSHEAKKLSSDYFTRLMKEAETVDEARELVRELRTYKYSEGKDYTLIIERFSNSLEMRINHFNVGHQLHQTGTEIIQNRATYAERDLQFRKLRPLSHDKDLVTDYLMQNVKFWTYGRMEIEQMSDAIVANREVLSQAGTRSLLEVADDVMFMTEHAKVIYSLAHAHTTWWQRIKFDGGKKLKNKIKNIYHDKAKDKKWIAEKARQLKGVYQDKAKEMTEPEIESAIKSMEIADITIGYEKTLQRIKKQEQKDRRDIMKLGTVSVLSSLVFQHKNTLVAMAPYLLGAGQKIAGNSASAAEVNYEDVFGGSQDTIPTPTGTDQVSRPRKIKEPEGQAPRQVDTPTPPAPTEQPTNTPEPPTATPDTLLAEIGNRNILEYLVGNLQKEILHKRLARAEANGAVRERVNPAFLNPEDPASHYINFAFLGVDMSRERDFYDNGNGLSDVMMMISINPYTFDVRLASVPRDTVSPEVNDLAKYKPPKANAMVVADWNLFAEGRKVDGQVAERYDFVKCLFENATGIPVDGVIHTTIDFFRGHKPDSIQSILDFIFTADNPLRMEVPYNYVDNQYPQGRDVKTIKFTKGEILSDAERVVEFVRSRKGVITDEQGNTIRGVSDTDRQKKMHALVLSVVSSMKDSILRDGIGVVDRVLSGFAQGLKYQADNKNLYYDNKLDIVKIFQIISDAWINLSPQARAQLMMNSVDELESFVTDDTKLQTASINILEFPSAPNTGYGHLLSTKYYKIKNAWGDYVQYYEAIRSKVRGIFGLAE